MKKLTSIITGLMIAFLAFVTYSCGGGEQLTNILTSVLNGQGTEAMVTGSGKGAVTVSMNTRGLKKTNVTVGDGEFDYYSYPNAYVGNVIVTLSKLPESVEELRTINLPNRMTDIHQSPYVLLPLYVAALYQYSKNKAVGKAMIEYIGRQEPGYGKAGVIEHCFAVFSDRPVLQQQGKPQLHGVCSDVFRQYKSTLHNDYRTLQ